MTADTARELAMLRRRAYGPDADIDTDPAALARLRYLEQSAPADAIPAAPDTDEPPPARGATSAQPDEPTEPPAASAKPWWRRPAVWIAAVAVVLLVVAAAVVTTVSNRPDRVLTATPAESEIPFPDDYQWLIGTIGIERDSLRSFLGVGDIVVWAGRSADGVSCVLITSSGGPFGFGCSRDGHDPTADVVLDSSGVARTETGIPDRSTIRFVYRGDHVDVWITRAPEPTRSS